MRHSLRTPHSQPFDMTAAAAGTAVALPPPVTARRQPLLLVVAALLCLLDLSLSEAAQRRNPGGRRADRGDARVRSRAAVRRRPTGKLARRAKRPRRAPRVRNAARVLTAPLAPDAPLTEELVAPYVRDASEPIKGASLPEASERDLTYLRVLIDGVRTSLAREFVPWLDGGGPRDASGFRRMLIEQHRRIVAGGYGGYFSTFESASFFGRQSVTSGTRLDNAGSMNAERGGGGGATDRLVLRLTEREVGLLARELEPDIELTVDVEGIPDEARPTNQFRKGTRLPVHLYPAARHEAVYVASLATLMGEARARLARRDRAGLVDALARYYHVGANSHLFERGNNSLFMSQVNYLLARAGLRPMSHGDLDRDALVMDVGDFRGHFRAAVDRAQSRD